MDTTCVYHEVIVRAKDLQMYLERPQKGDCGSEELLSYPGSGHNLHTVCRETSLLLQGLSVTGLQWVIMSGPTNPDLFCLSSENGLVSLVLVDIWVFSTAGTLRSSCDLSVLPDSSVHSSL